MMIIAETVKNGIKVNLDGTGEKILQELGATLKAVEHMCEKTSISNSSASEFVKAAVDLYVCIALANERKGAENK